MSLSILKAATSQFLEDAAAASGPAGNAAGPGEPMGRTHISITMWLHAVEGQEEIPGKRISAVGCLS